MNSYRKRKFSRSYSRESISAKKKRGSSNHNPDFSAPLIATKNKAASVHEVTQSKDDQAIKQKTRSSHHVDQRKLKHGIFSMFKSLSLSTSTFIPEDKSGCVDFQPQQPQSIARASANRTTWGARISRTFRQSIRSVGHWHRESVQSEDSGVSLTSPSPDERSHSDASSTETVFFSKSDKVIETTAKDSATLQPVMRTKVNKCWKEPPTLRNVLEELLKTERDYISILHYIKTGIYLPLKLESTLFKEEHVELVFRGFDDLLRFHIKFCCELQCAAVLSDEIEAVDQVAQVFIKWIPDMTELYKNYTTATRHLATSIVKHWRKSPKREECIKKCIKIQEILGMKRGVCLKSQIARCSQFTIKYKMIIDELYKYIANILTLDGGASEKNQSQIENESVSNWYKTLLRRRTNTLNNVKRLKQMIYEMCDSVNKEMTMFEEAREVIEIENKILNTQDLEEGELFPHNRKLVHHGELSSKTVRMGFLAKPITYHVFLFDKDLICCSKSKQWDYLYKVEKQINLSSIGFDWVDIHDGQPDFVFGEQTNAWKIWNRSQNCWQLFKADKPQVKNEWIKALKKLRESESTEICLKNLINAVQKLKKHVPPTDDDVSDESIGIGIL